MIMRSKLLVTLLKLPTTGLRLLTTVSSQTQVTTAAASFPSSSAVDPAQLCSICTILHQQQHSPNSRLHAKLHASVSTSQSTVDSELFLRVCNTFPLSWRPVYRFYQFTLTLPSFSHSSVTLNKVIGIVGNSKNIDLFWELLLHMARQRLVDRKTFRIALKTLAEVRELKKCVQFFHLMNEHSWEYDLETLNMVAETLCGAKLVQEAKFVIFKLQEWIKPDRITYGWLIRGFCEVGDLIEASKIWNLMVDEGFDPDTGAMESIMETLFKTNRYDEALKLFQMMRVRMMDELGLSTYRLVIDWMCKRGKAAQAYMVFDEMQKRGVEVDNPTLSSLIYGLLARGRAREAYKIAEGVRNPDISIPHGLIKGLLKLKRPSEATQVFREMIRRGFEPTMHTYIMLLQGHFGRRGRKGSDLVVNFENIFIGGLVNAGKSLEATKFVERTMNGGVEVPRFDYNKFLHYYSTEEGVVMFEEVSKKLREAGMVDLADIFQRYGEKMATRDRRRNREYETNQIRV